MRSLQEKNIKAGETEKTFNLEEKENHCAQRQNCRRWRKHLFGKERLRQWFPNLKDHHSDLESFVEYRFLGLTLRDSREDLGEALETVFLK